MHLKEKRKSQKERRGKRNISNENISAGSVKTKVDTKEKEIIVLLFCILLTARNDGRGCEPLSYVQKETAF